MEEHEPRVMKFDKPVNFSEKILIGNWVENRSAYTKNSFKHETTYSNEFVEKPFDENSANVVWDQKLQAEGHGFSSPQTSTEPCGFYDNYSTTYNLSYKYFPRWYGSPIFRNLRFRMGKFEPQEEYLNSYGNTSNYGLSNYKRDVWKCDIQDPRTTATTSYEDSFLTPEKSDYTHFHWCRTTPIKDDHPSLPKCNIITWECNDENDDRCC